MTVRNRKLRRYLDHARNKFKVPPEIIDGIAAVEETIGGKRGAKAGIRRFREARTKTGIGI